MFGLDPAVVTLIQGFCVAVVSTAGAVLWGIWDRRRLDRKDKHESTLGDAQFISANMKQHLIDITENRDYWENLAKERMQAEQNCFKDRDLVWDTFRYFSELAHDLRHEAGRIIFNLAIELKHDPKQYRLKELPSIHHLYNVKSAERNKDNEQLGKLP